MKTDYAGCSFYFFNDSEKNEFCMKNHLTLNDDSFLYYTGYRWWTVNANFFRNKQHSFLKSRRFLWKKRIVTWLFEGKQDIIGNKSIHQVYAFIKSKRKKRKNRKKKSEKRETVRMRGNDWTKGKTGCNNENSGGRFIIISIRR